MINVCFNECYIIICGLNRTINLYFQYRTSDIKLNENHEYGGTVETVCGVFFGGGGGGREPGTYILEKWRSGHAKIYARYNISQRGSMRLGYDKRKKYIANW